jgi:hypothetical protein
MIFSASVDSRRSARAASRFTTRGGDTQARKNPARVTEAVERALWVIVAAALVRWEGHLGVPAARG